MSQELIDKSRKTEKILTRLELVFQLIRYLTEVLFVFFIAVRIFEFKEFFKIIINHGFGTFLFILVIFFFIRRIFRKKYKRILESLDEDMSKEGNENKYYSRILTQLDY